MPGERRQFRILFRDFLSRMIDLELLSAQGDIRKLLGQFAALLAAFGFLLAVTMLPRYLLWRQSVERLAMAAWGDEEFLISTTIAIVGLFAVIAWNTVLPDRRDSLVLGPLPVRTRTILAAKIAALAAALAVSVFTLNFLTGLAIPLFAGGVRTLLAYWITLAAAAVFVFCGLLAVQGVAAQVLGYAWFLRVSSFLQLGSFFLIVSLFFLTPPLATVHGLTAPGNQRLLQWLPSFWFLGLFQELNGSAGTVFAPLASQALRNLSLSLVIAAATYALTWYRYGRRIVEQPDIGPADRSRLTARAVTVAAAKLLPKPLDRAILLFTARTIARSRHHRFLLAAYGGVGLALALVYAKELIYGYAPLPWNQLTMPGLVASLILLAFAVIAGRAVFVLPVSLPANWIFRLTAVHSPEAYFVAVRKSLLTLTVAPMWAASAIVYLTIWPSRPALEHVAVLGVAGVLLVDLLLYRFRKIPFACSYLPGGGDLKLKLGLYGALLLVVANAGTGIEYLALKKFTRFAFFLTLLAAVAGWAWRRWAEFARDPYSGLQFEDVPVADVTVLGLGQDAPPAGAEAYIDLKERPIEIT